MSDEVDRIPLDPEDPIGNIGNDANLDDQNHNCTHAEKKLTKPKKDDLLISTDQPFPKNVSIINNQKESAFNQSDALKKKHHNSNHYEDIATNENDVQTERNLSRENLCIVKSENVGTCPVGVSPGVARCSKLDVSLNAEPHRPTNKERLNKCKKTC